MNILVPLSWLKDFVQTKASPEVIAEKLSLCGFSVERMTKWGSNPPKPAEEKSQTLGTSSESDSGESAGPEDDMVFEIEITPNRPDALSILGIAREIGAILPQFGINAKFSDNIRDLKIKTPESPLKLRVMIENPELCPRFAALILNNIRVGESPKKIRDRLEKVGVRSLSNAIDITNYIMIERGQPMHIFDYDKIAGATMTLRKSRVGEKIITLDGQERALPEGAIIIEDGEKIIDLCGIMGGENPSVDENTTRVVLFVQIYDPMRIRKTTQKMAFRTEASSRFEKGMDPRGVVPALKQAARFLIEEAQGKIARDLIDIENRTYEPHQVAVTIEQIENLLGIDIEPAKITQILKPLGFEARWTTAPNDITTVPEIKVTVPSWRAEDIKIPEDIIEEIARIYGYHNLPQRLPPLPRRLGTEEEIFLWERKTRNLLKGWGFDEIYTYSFTSKDILQKAGFSLENTLEIKNPLTKDLTHLRPNLLPQLLEVVFRNQAHHEEQKLFQLNRVFIPQEGGKLPEEPQRLSGLLYRQNTGSTLADLFYQAKGVVEALLSELGIKSVSFSSLDDTLNTIWHPKKSAEISQKSLPSKASAKGGARIGTLGLVKPEILTNFKINGPIAAFDLDFDTIANLAAKEKTYQPIPEYPPIIEDLTFEVGEEIPVGEITKKVLSIKYQVLSGIDTEIKDIYKDRELEKQRKKAVTFKITYQPKDRGLSDKEVKPIREEIIKEVEKEFGAKLRGK